MKRIALVAAVLIVAVVAVPSADAQSNAQETRWVAISQTAVRNRLRDPNSAQFSDVYFTRAQLGGRRITVVCGRVNSRNGFGGYSGTQRFIASGNDLVFLEEEVADFDVSWRQICLPRPNR